MPEVAAVGREEESVRDLQGQGHTFLLSVINVWFGYAMRRKKMDQTLRRTPVTSEETPFDRGDLSPPRGETKELFSFKRNEKNFVKK